MKRQTGVRVEADMWENLDRFVGRFLKLSDKLGNLNDKVWSLTLNETSNFIDEVTKRNKHHPQAN